MPDFEAPAFDAPASSDSISQMDPFAPDFDIDTESPPPPEDNTPIDPFKGTKHKIKAKGKEIELDYEDLLKKAEKAEGADQIFQESAATRKKLAALEAKFAKLSGQEIDPFEVVETMGWENAKKFADTLMRKQLEWEQLPEHEQELILERQRAEETAEKLRSYEEREKTAKSEADRGMAVSLVDQEVSAALAFAKEQGLSIAEAPYFAERVVDELLAFLEYCDTEEKAGRPITREPPTAVDVARKLQEHSDESTKSLLKKLKAKDLRSMLTKEQLDDLRQSQIDDLYTPIPRTQASKREVAEDAINPFQTQNQAPSKPTTSNWFAEMDKKLGVRK